MTVPRSVRRALRPVLVAVAVSCGADAPAGPVVPASVTITPGADTLTALGAGRRLSAVVRDAAGNPLLDQVIRWRSSAPAIVHVDSITGQATAEANGLATISAAAGGVEGHASVVVRQSVASVAITPNSLALVAMADTARLAAVARDSLGAVVAELRFLWVSSDATVATVDTAGLVTARGTGQAVISAAGRGVPGHAAVGVTQAAVALAFSVPPTDAVAGAAISPAVQVEVRDAAGVLVTGSRIDVTIAMGANPGGGTLAGSRTVNAVGGIATFAGLWIDRAGAGYSLVASAPSLGPATSAPFGVSAGPPAALSLDPPPSDVVEGNVAMPAVRVAVLDAFGNLVTGAGGAVSLSLARVPWPGVSLGGTVNQPVNGGYAAFPDLVLSRPGSGNVVRAAYGGVRAESDAVTVSLSFTTEVAGGTHSCGLAPGGTFCWGQNHHGQLGTPSAEVFLDSVPRPVAGDFVELALGAAHTCGRTAGGAVYCWGANAQGQLGNGTTTNASTPSLVQGSGTAIVFMSIGAGELSTCGLDVSGSAHCWGYAGAYSLGDGQNTVNQTSPTAVLGGFQFTALGVSYSPCGLVAGGAVYCWGLNANGEVGDSTTTPRPTPTQVAGSGTGNRVFIAVAAGTGFACAIDTAERAQCWGRNDQLQLGRGGEPRVPGFVLTGHLGGLTWLSLRAGGAHVCGVATGGIGVCWGSNLQGQMGFNNPSPNGLAELVVTAVPGFTFSAMTAGNQHSCAHGTAAGAEQRVLCWGNNSVGQLGNGATGSPRYFGVPVVQ